MLCMGILWNSVHEYKEQALLDIKESADLLGSFDLQLDENYEQFVRGKRYIFSRKNGFVED